MFAIKLLCITGICALAMHAQTVNITGTVKDTAGNPIAGALVRLEYAGLATTSLADGSFTLPGTVGVRPGAGLAATLGHSAFVGGGRLNLLVSSRTDIEIAAHDLNGRRAGVFSTTVDAGRHSVVLPRAGRTTYLYRARIGGTEYVFRGGHAGTLAPAAAGGGAPVSSLRKSTTTVEDPSQVDIITVTKGLCDYLDYSEALPGTEISGLEIVMLPCADTVRDIDGYLYQAVRLGDQVWTTSNLRVTRLNDNTPITHAFDANVWKSHSETGSIPAYCFYANSTHRIVDANDPAFQKKWGANYNWFAVGTGKLAPAGWRVASENEWYQLERWLIQNGYSWNGTTTGTDYTLVIAAMSSKTDWFNYTERSPDFTGAPQPGFPGYNMRSNNRSGLSILPNGMRFTSGWDQLLGNRCFIWSSTEYDNSAFHQGFRFNIPGQYRVHHKGYGAAVRLIRNN